MKRISIILAILVLATVSHAWESKTEYRNASGDQAYISADATTGDITIQNPDDEEGYYPLRTPDIGDTVQAHDDVLDDLSELTSPVSANVLTFLGAADYDAMSALLSVKKAEQSETIDNEGTLTLDQADELRVYLTCNANPTNITLAKSGNEVTGNIAHLIVSGTNPGIFSDQAGILELDGKTILDQGKVLTIIFVTDRWYQLGRPSGANLYIDDINLYDSDTETYGTIQGAKKVFVATGDLNLTAEQMNSDILIASGGTASLPPGIAIDLGGAYIRCTRMTTAAYYIKSNDAADMFVLNDGTVLDANDKIGTGTSKGSRFEIVNYQANKWHVVQGTATDEGAVTGAGTYLTDADAIAAYYFENDATDETANGYDLTAVNTPTYETTTPAPKQGTYSSEHVWYAVAGQYFSSSDAAFDQLTTGSFSFVGWFYPTYDSASTGIMSKGTTPGDLGINLYRYNTDDSIRLRASTDGTTDNLAIGSATGSFPLNEWTHIALTYDGSTFHLYINGYEHTGGNFSGPGYAYSDGIQDSDDDFWFLRANSYSGSIRNFGGNADELYVTEEVLTPAKVLDIFANGLE